MDYETNEELIASTLETLSPSLIVNSPGLLRCFRGFVFRCTENERRILFNSPSGQEAAAATALEIERPEEANQRDSSFDIDITPFIAEAASSPVVVGLGQRTCFPFTSEGLETSNFSLVTSDLPFSSSSRPDGVTETGSTDAAYAPLGNHTNAAAFFRARLGSRKSRTTYLVRALQGLISAMGLDGARYANLWSARERIFSGIGTGPVARFQRLFHGFLRVKRGRDDYDCASRLCHIFLEHDLEQLATSDLLHLSRGRGRKSAALSLQAASISATVDAVRTDRKAGQRYMQILMDAGPGLLLMLGSQVNTVWERKLSKGDVALLLEYLRLQQPEILEKGCSLDKAATALILQGFIAYGWTYKELAERPSRVINRLSSYTDVTELALQRDMDATTLHYPLGGTLLTDGDKLVLDNAQLDFFNPASYGRNDITELIADNSQEVMPHWCDANEETIASATIDDTDDRRILV